MQTKHVLILYFLKFESLLMFEGLKNSKNGWYHYVICLLLYLDTILNSTSFTQWSLTINVVGT